MPLFVHEPTEDQLQFLMWAKICLGNKSYKYVLRKNNGYNVSKIAREIQLLNSRIEVISNYVYLSEKERVCLGCEEIAGIVRRVKESCADC